MAKSVATSLPMAEGALGSALTNSSVTARLVDSGNVSIPISASRRANLTTALNPEFFHLLLLAS